jgi:hypothetical protein
VPPWRDRTVTFSLSPIHKAADSCIATAELTTAVSRGELSPNEAESLIRIIEVYARILVTHDFEERLEKLEKEQRSELSATGCAPLSL